jgi:hypothetical protein
MMRKAAGSIPLSVFAALSIGAAALGRRSPTDDMAGAAARFLAALSPDLRTKVNLKFDDPARTDWHFVPRSRPGITFGEMNDAQRSAARDVLRSALSSRGMLKAEGIMALDAVLRDLEKASGGDGASRDPLSYTMALYGNPGQVPWGWKIEGHHLSLNFTVAMDDAVSSSPAFMGAHPTRISRGPQAGLRVLALEEDLGRQLARSLGEAQKKDGILAGEVPREILTMPGRSLDTAPPVGLLYSSMTSAQQAMTMQLIEEYAYNLRHDLATTEMERIHKAGLDRVRFAWAGDVEPGRPHYYRISGPTFVIEYDNTQNNADHVHTVWHDRERDFGKDLLKQHYEDGHEHK